MRRRVFFVVIVNQPHHLSILLLCTSRLLCLCHSLASAPQLFCRVLELLYCLENIEEVAFIFQIQTMRNNSLSSPHDILLSSYWGVALQTYRCIFLSYRLSNRTLFIFSTAFCRSWMSNCNESCSRRGSIIVYVWIRPHMFYIFRIDILSCTHFMLKLMPSFILACSMGICIIDTRSWSEDNSYCLCNYSSLIT